MGEGENREKERERERQREREGEFMPHMDGRAGLSAQCAGGKKREGPGEGGRERERGKGSGREGQGEGAHTGPLLSARQGEGEREPKTGGWHGRLVFRCLNDTTARKTS